MKDETNITLQGAPNIKYEKFFEKFKEIETLEVDKWSAVHVLAYFCKKYEGTYGVPYKFKFNSPSPVKCFEVFQVKKLSSLLTRQPKLLKNYIDWIYENKVIKAKRRLTSISFMTNEALMFEYRDNVLMAEQKTTINRSTALPENYKSVFMKAGVNISTYGELAFLSQMEDLSANMLTAFNDIENLGFDRSVLGKIV